MGVALPIKLASSSPAPNYIYLEDCPVKGDACILGSISERLECFVVLFCFSNLCGPNLGATHTMLKDSEIFSSGKYF